MVPIMKDYLYLSSYPRSLPVSSAPRFGAHLVTSSTRRNGASGGETVRREDEERGPSLRGTGPDTPHFILHLVVSYARPHVTRSFLRYAHPLSAPGVRLGPFPLTPVSLPPSPHLTPLATLVHAVRIGGRMTTR